MYSQSDSQTLAPTSHDIPVSYHKQTVVKMLVVQPPMEGIVGLRTGVQPTEYHVQMSKGRLTLSAHLEYLLSCLQKQSSCGDQYEKRSHPFATELDLVISLLSSSGRLCFTRRWESTRASGSRRVRSPPRTCTRTFVALCT